MQTKVKIKERLSKDINSKLSNFISLMIKSLFVRRIIDEKNKIKTDLIEGFKLLISSKIPKKNINVAQIINSIENLFTKKKKLK